jgi:hypothetical protein
MDQICLEVDLPTAFPEMKYAASFRADARYDYGETWCKEVLGVVPEIVNVRV